MTSRVKWRRVTNANCRQHPSPPPPSQCLATLNGTNTFVSRTRVFFFFLSLVEHAHKSSVTLSWWFRVINRQLFRRLVYIWGVRLIVATTHTLTLTHTHSAWVTCVLTLFPTVLAPKMLRTFWPLIKLSHGSIINECVTVCVCVRECVSGQSVAVSLGCRYLLDFW